MNMKNYFVLILLISANLTSSGQNIDASPVGIMISHSHPKGGWMASYSYMNMEMKDNLAGDHVITKDDIFFKNYNMAPEKMRMQMHMLMLMYGITGRLSVMAMASYNDNSMNMESYAAGHVHGGSTDVTPGVFHSHHSSGLSDIKLWALYKLFNGENSSVVLSAGINIPTGSIDIAKGEHSTFPGEHQAYMMQLGTGSFDLMPGLTYYKRSGKIAWSAQVLGNVRPFYNSNDYRTGSDVTLNIWGAYLFCSNLSASLRAEAIYGGSISGKDAAINSLSEPDAAIENHGGLKTNSYAGINYYINKSILKDTKIGIEAGIPFYQYVNGIQMSNSFTWFASITKSF
jgi:hypothetical protein